MRPALNAVSGTGEVTVFSPGVAEVVVTKAVDLEHALHNAVTLVMETAMERRTGIMMTRLGIGRYIVQVHPEVPVGLIRERHVLKADQ